jgi:signal transduction histidine kinase
MNECSINTSSLDTVLNYDTDSELLAALEASMSDWNVFFNDADVDEKDILLNELRRLQVLKSSGILNLNQKLHLEHLTALTSRIFDVPISLVSIVDLGRLWSASNQGFGDVHETPRISSALCSHAIQSPQDVFVVPDTLNDSRFKNNPLVTGAPYVRFYASSPLTNRDGYKLGNLCIIDVKPHANGLSFKDQQNLVDIAALVMAHIDSKRRYKEENDKFKAETVATTAHDLITPLSAIQLNMELMCDDDELMNRLGERYKILLDQTKECVDLLANICQRAIQSYREICITSSTKLVSKDGGDIVDTSKFVSTLKHIMETYPKKVPLTIRIGEDVPRFIESDIISLFRSSINLLTNACKVTTSGFIDFNLHLEPATSVQNPVPMLVFECLDTGPGIEVKDLSHLFSADGGMMLSQKSENSGSGLGLNSVRELITRIGGQFGYKPRE